MSSIDLALHLDILLLGLLLETVETFNVAVSQTMLLQLKLLLLPPRELQGSYI
jgi:hypothetical protein